MAMRHRREGMSLNRRFGRGLASGEERAEAGALTAGLAGATAAAAAGIGAKLTAKTGAAAGASRGASGAGGFFPGSSRLAVTLLAAGLGGAFFLWPGVAAFCAFST